MSAAVTLDPFYLIVDSADWLDRLLPLGVRLVQLRVKDRPGDEVRRQVRRALAACRSRGAQLIVNDYWQTALEEGCDFVHLGQGDLDEADLPALRRGGVRFGLSSHDEAELERALSTDPAYVALGPIYPTLLKQMPWAPQGLERLAHWRRAVGDLPLVAIGGLTPERLPGIFAAGADSAAVVTDVLRNAHPEQRTREWIAATSGKRMPGGGRHRAQMVLPEIGPKGQAKLAAARVLVVGAGGLGAPVLQYLAGAGVGNLVLVDPDVVEEHNLHRQVLFGLRDIGRPKVEAAREALLALDPTLRIEARRQRLDPGNAPELVASVDIVIDAADSFAATYALSDVCCDLGKPLVSASVIGLEGYVGTFCAGAPSYRAVFPDMPDRAANCATAGVLGSAVAVMGSLQAHAALSLLLELDASLKGRIVRIDFRTLAIGGFSFRGAPEPTEKPVPFVALADVGARDLVVDLRSASEAPSPAVESALRLSVEDLAAGAPLPPTEGRIVLACRTGVRSARAAGILKARGCSDLALLAIG